MPKRINLDPTKIYEANLGILESSALNEFLKSRHIGDMWVKNQEYQYTSIQGIDYI